MEERDKNIITQNQAEDEIDLVEIIQKLWRNRKFILKVTAVFAVLGFIIAISTPNVYTASCTMVPQTGQKSTSGSLGGLAAMAGINLGGLGSGEVLSPTVYPKIMNNVNFQKELIYSKFHFQGVKQPITLYDYYTNKKYQKFSLLSNIKKYTIGLPRVAIGFIKGTVKNDSENIIKSDSLSLQSLTSNEKIVVQFVSSSLLLNINNKEGYITISANSSEPIIAAELAQRGQELLQKFITKFKVEKVTQNLEFVERNYQESKRNFESKQAELARFRDANRGFSTALAKAQEEKLTSEYSLMLGIYTELAKQKEQAKIAVTETMPILTIIEPIVVPSEKNKSGRATILFIYVFIGLIIGVGIVFTVPYFEETFKINIKKYWFIPKIA